MGKRFEYVLARDLGMLRAELLDRLDQLEPQEREREMSEWRALYALEAEERRKAEQARGRRR